MPHLDQFQTVLDFGGGSGGRTSGLIDDGKELSLIEVESDYSEAAYDLGIKRHQDGAKYDLIVVSHVIEHLLDPKKEIGDVIKDYGKPSGLIAISTPMIEFVKPYKWLSMFHISHKYYFNIPALIGLMAEIGARPIAQDSTGSVLFRISEPDLEEGAAQYAKGLRLAQRLEGSARRRLKKWRPSSLSRRWKNSAGRSSAPVF